MAIKRALTLQNILDANVPKFPFEGEWHEAFGTPERTGAWYVYGGSGSGKTNFILQLIKELSRYGLALFVSYEEGEVSAALQDGIRRYGMLSAKSKVLVCADSLEELTERLNRRKSPDIVFIDSLEYSEFKNIKQVRSYVMQFPKKLFVFIGQAKGKNPKSEFGESVLFYAKQKIYTEGYRAFTRGRSFGEKGYFTIWAKGAEEYW